MSSILAIDYGLKRIGLAISDPTQTFSFAHGVIENKSFEHVILEIGKVIKEKEVTLILIGMPLNMNSSKGKMAQSVEDFAKNLQKRLNIAIEFVDERLSSFQAEENLKESKLSSKKIKQYVDAEAARLLLEDYIANV